MKKNKYVVVAIEIKTGHQTTEVIFATGAIQAALEHSMCPMFDRSVLMPRTIKGVQMIFKALSDIDLRVSKI